MKRHRVVLIYSNPDLARAISPTLGDATYDVRVASSLEQARAFLRGHDFNSVVADLESLSLAQVKALQWEYGAQVVCVHRNASDSMWVDALTAGAVDCCYPDDRISINRALHTGRHVKPAALAVAA